MLIASYHFCGDRCYFLAMDRLYFNSKWNLMNWEAIQFRWKLQAFLRNFLRLSSALPCIHLTAGHCVELLTTLGALVDNLTEADLEYPRALVKSANSPTRADVSSVAPLCRQRLSAFESCARTFERHAESHLNKWNLNDFQIHRIRSVVAVRALLCSMPECGPILTLNMQMTGKRPIRGKKKSKKHTADTQSKVVRLRCIRAVHRAAV